MLLVFERKSYEDNEIGARRPDFIIIDKKEHKAIIIDIAVSADVNVEEERKDRKVSRPK